MGAGGRRDNDLDLPQHRGERGADTDDLGKHTLQGLVRTELSHAPKWREQWLSQHVLGRPRVLGVMCRDVAKQRASCNPKVITDTLDEGGSRLIGGVLGAGVMTIETMKLVADKVQGAIIEQCGHYTPEECPGPFSELVKSFLAE
jgi:hypothetical protein